MESLYSFRVKNASGQEVAMSEFKSKVLLIVNVASRCGFTPQYTELESLYKKYADRGFVILGFPCNQFAGQEPGSDSEIQSFCQLNYGVTFPVMAKIDVNGANTQPLYQFLKSKAPGVLWTQNIKWNFTKFLIDRNGKIIERFAPSTQPMKLSQKIEKLL